MCTPVINIKGNSIRNCHLVVRNDLGKTKVSLINHIWGLASFPDDPKNKHQWKSTETNKGLFYFRGRKHWFPANAL